MNKPIWELQLILGDPRFAPADFGLPADSKGVGACGFANHVGKPNSEKIVGVKLASPALGVRIEECTSCLTGTLFNSHA
jgi:hypothetical protein